MPEERGGVWGSCMAAEGDEKLTVQLSTNKHAHREKKAMLKTESIFHYLLLKLMMTCILIMMTYLMTSNKQYLIVPRTAVTLLPLSIEGL